MGQHFKEIALPEDTTLATEKVAALSTRIQTRSDAYAVEAYAWLGRISQHPPWEVASAASDVITTRWSGLQLQRKFTFPGFDENEEELVEIMPESFEIVSSARMVLLELVRNNGALTLHEIKKYLIRHLGPRAGLTFVLPALQNTYIDLEGTLTEPVATLENDTLHLSPAMIEKLTADYPVLNTTVQVTELISDRDAEYTLGVKDRINDFFESVHRAVGDPIGDEISSDQTVTLGNHQYELEYSHLTTMQIDTVSIDRKRIDENQADGRLRILFFTPAGIKQLEVDRGFLPHLPEGLDPESVYISEENVYLNWRDVSGKEVTYLSVILATPYDSSDEEEPIDSYNTHVSGNPYQMIVQSDDSKYELIKNKKIRFTKDEAHFQMQFQGVPYEVSYKKMEAGITIEARGDGWKKEILVPYDLNPQVFVDEILGKCRPAVEELESQSAGEGT